MAQRRPSLVFKGQMLFLEFPIPVKACAIDSMTIIERWAEVDAESSNLSQGVLELAQE